MPTRGIYGFRKGNIDKLTFCYRDGFMQTLGKEIVKFIKETPVETMNKIFDRIILVDGTIQDEKKSKTYSKMKEYRDNGLKYMIDGSKYITDIYKSDYAYIINLDTREFEIYSLVRFKVLEGRYNNDLPDGKIGCRLIKKYELENIPSNWIKECNHVIYNDIIKLK